MITIRVYMTGDPKLYIPFRGEVPGSERGKHHLNMSPPEKDDAKALAYCKQHALDIFPEATITEVWVINPFEPSRELHKQHLRRLE
jgi:hypothetical protein